MMRVDIWSDLMCPFCYIGKRRLENVAKAENIPLEVTWHSFELNPEAPPVYGVSMVKLLAEKYGMSEAQAIASNQQLAIMAASEGITFNWQKLKPGNSFNAHRLCHLAQASGKGDAAEELFFAAYMTNGEVISDSHVITRIGQELGFAKAEVEKLLSSDLYTKEVRADEAQAQAMNLHGVPFFVFEGKLALSGAQPREAFSAALHQAQDKEKSSSTQPAASDNALCTDDLCAVPPDKA